MPWLELRPGKAAVKNQWTTKANYPFLNVAFGQQVTVAVIIDVYVLDVIAVLLIDLALFGLVRGGRCGRSRSLCIVSGVAMRIGAGEWWAAHRANRRHLDMLDALLRSNLLGDPRRSSRSASSSFSLAKLPGLARGRAV